jgi:hypothetical protein
MYTNLNSTITQLKLNLVYGEPGLEDVLQSIESLNLLYSKTV